MHSFQLVILSWPTFGAVSCHLWNEKHLAVSLPLPSPAGMGIHPKLRLKLPLLSLTCVQLTIWTQCQNGVKFCRKQFQCWMMWVGGRGTLLCTPPYNRATFSPFLFDYSNYAVNSVAYGTRPAKRGSISPEEGHTELQYEDKAPGMNPPHVCHIPLQTGDKELGLVRGSQTQITWKYI